MSAASSLFSLLLYVRVSIHFLFPVTAAVTFYRPSVLGDKNANVKVAKSRQVSYKSRANGPSPGTQTQGKKQICRFIILFERITFLYHSSLSLFFFIESRFVYLSLSLFL